MDALIIENLNLLHVFLLAIATYRLSRLLIEDVIFEPLRERIWKRFPPESTRIGYFFTCYWCTSLWIALVVVALYLLVPTLALSLALVLTCSAAAGLLDRHLS